MKAMAAIFLLGSLVFLFVGAVKAQRGELMSVVYVLTAIWCVLMVIASKMVLAGWLFP